MLTVNISCLMLFQLFKHETQGCKLWNPRVAVAKARELMNEWYHIDIIWYRMIDFEREGPATTDTKQHIQTVHALHCSWFMVSCLLKIGQQTTGFLARMVNSHKTWFEADLSVARDREHFCLFHASLNGIFWLKPAHPPWQWRLGK